MSFATDLFSFVTASAPVKAYIGTRLYQRVLPAISPWPGCSAVCRVITGVKEQSHDGDSHLKRSTVQFDIYSRKENEPGAVLEALNALFLPFRGTVGSTPVGSVLHVHDSDSYETETRLFRTSVDFEFWHQTT